MRVSLEARYTDYDTKGHVNNAVYLTYFEVARVHAWRAIMPADVDPSFILAEAIVRYRRPAHIGVPLAAEITTAEIRRKAWVWQYRVLDVRDETVLAEGSTVQVMYDYATGTTQAIPPLVRDGLERL